MHLSSYGSSVLHMHVALPDGIVLYHARLHTLEFLKLKKKGWHLSIVQEVIESLQPECQCAIKVVEWEDQQTPDYIYYGFGSIIV